MHRTTWGQYLFGWCLVIVKLFEGITLLNSKSKIIIVCWIILNNLISTLCFEILIFLLYKTYLEYTIFKIRI